MPRSFTPRRTVRDFELRIRIYRNKGYFPPEDADRLIEMCRQSEVHVPEIILRRFVDTYRRGSGTE